MPVITMPDGTPVSFPDDMPRDQIRSLITKKFPDIAPKDTSFGAPMREAATRPPVTTRGEAAKAAFTDIPSAVGREYVGAAEPIKTFGEWARGAGAQQDPSMGTIWEGIKKGAQAAGGAMYLGTGVGPAIVGAAKSLVGHGLQAAEPSIPYEEAEAGVGEAAMLATPRFRGGAGVPGAQPQMPGGEFGIRQPGGPIPKTLSEAGKQQEAAFTARQATESQAAKERIQAGFDVLGEPSARTPGEAGAAVSEDIRAREQAARGEVSAAYGEARAAGGAIKTGAFGHVADNIKLGIENDAARAAGGPNEEDAIILNEITTPAANASLPYLQRRIESLTQPPQTQAQTIREQADALFSKTTPRINKNTSTIGGISLNNIDQIRKELSSFRSRAFDSGNKQDARAMSRIMQLFDEQIDAMVNSKYFQGNPLAIKAWNAARAKHYDYKRMFSSQGRGTVGDVISKIVGKRGVGPAIANDVADYIYGSSGVNPNSLNVAVTRTVKQMAGETSKTWSAIRSGLLERITNPKGLDPKQGQFPDSGGVKTRLLRFLDGDGKEMAELVYSKQERDLLHRFAEVHGQLDPEKTGKMGGFLKRFADIMGHRINLVMAAVLLRGGVSGALGAAAIAGARGVANVVSGMREASALARNIPTLEQDLLRLENELASWQRNVLRAQAQPTLANRQKQLTATFDLGAALRRFGINDLIQQPSAADRRNDKDRDKLSPKNVIYGGAHM